MKQNNNNHKTKQNNNNNNNTKKQNNEIILIIPKLNEKFEYQNHKIINMTNLLKYESKQINDINKNFVIINCNLQHKMLLNITLQVKQLLNTNSIKCGYCNKTIQQECLFFCAKKEHSKNTTKAFKCLFCVAKLLNN